MTDEPSKLVDAIEVAKATKQIVMQNIVIALGIKSLPTVRRLEPPFLTSVLLL